MKRLLLVAATLMVAGCGMREGTEAAGEPDAFATITSGSRPPPALVDWMDTICGLTGWLADTAAAGPSLRGDAEADEFLSTAVVYVDTRLAQLTSLPKTYTDGDALVTNLNAALQAVRPAIVALTTGSRTAPLPDKLDRVVEVAALLDQARVVDPSITELIAEDAVLKTAHTMARDCA